MSKEAMKQALEALDIGLEYAESELYENRRRYEGYMHLAPDDQAYVNQIKEAIASLRQAIEQAEKQEPRCAVIVEVFGKDWRLDYMSLPVGKHKLYTQEYVYTTPQPKREWVGLTDEDRADLWEQNRASQTSHDDYACAIEQALKEKNT